MAFPSPTPLQDICLTWGLKWKKGSAGFQQDTIPVIITTCLLQVMGDGLDQDSPHQSLWTCCQDCKRTLRMMRRTWLRISDGAGSENLLDRTPEADERNKHLCRKQAKVKVRRGG